MWALSHRYLSTCNKLKLSQNCPANLMTIFFQCLYTSIHAYIDLCWIVNSCIHNNLYVLMKACSISALHTVSIDFTSNFMDLSRFLVNLSIFFFYEQKLYFVEPQEQWKLVFNKKFVILLDECKRGKVHIYDMIQPYNFRFNPIIFR